MKATLLAGAITAAIGSTASANGLYWVVGDRATNTCDIVTRNPTVFMYGGGDVWFGDGPYQIRRRRQTRPLDHSRLPER